MIHTLESLCGFIEENVIDDRHAMRTQILDPLKSTLMEFSKLKAMLEECIDIGKAKQNDYIINADFSPELRELSTEIQGVRDKMETAAEDGDWTAAIAAVNTLNAENPQYASLKLRLFRKMLHHADDPTVTFGYGREIMGDHWESAGTLNSLAWFTVDDEDAKHRDLGFALDELRSGAPHVRGVGRVPRQAQRRVGLDGGRDVRGTPVEDRPASVVRLARADPRGHAGEGGRA